MNRRIKAFEFTKELGKNGGIIVDVFKQIITLLPKDTVMVGTGVFQERNTYLIFFESEEFSEVPMCEMVPTFHPTIRTDDDGLITVLDLNISE